MTYRAYDNSAPGNGNTDLGLHVSGLRQAGNL